MSQPSPLFNQAKRAYGASSVLRNQREQDADIFQRLALALRAMTARSSVDQIRILADNRLLWSTVIDALRDERNPLALPLRTSIIEVGQTVLRELDKPNPDPEFMAVVNENFAAGLRGVS